MKWDAHSITWKVPLPGRGQSTPVIWGERMFLTTAIDDGRERRVLCLDRNDGKILWQQTAWTGEPEKSHIMNGWASASCVTDGQIVVAFFGIGGLHAYSRRGQAALVARSGLVCRTLGRGRLPGDRRRPRDSELRQRRETRI